MTDPPLLGRATNAKSQCPTAREPPELSQFGSSTFDGDGQHFQGRTNMTQLLAPRPPLVAASDTTTLGLQPGVIQAGLMGEHLAARRRLAKGRHKPRHSSHSAYLLVLHLLLLPI